MTIDDDLPFRVGADEREGTVSLKADLVAIMMRTRMIMWMMMAMILNSSIVPAAVAIVFVGGAAAVVT